MLSEKIHLSRASVGSEEKEAVCRVIDEGYLGMGQETMLFEKELESFFENKVHVTCVNTGTSALHLALQSCNIGDSHEVLVPSITYVASFQSITATGAKPVSCDINLENGCLDLKDARKKITDKTKAIMYVHYAGGVGDRDSIFHFAKEFGLRVIEDAAHSFGGSHKNRKIGEDGDIVCFSFDGIKNITCGEGGAIVSSDYNVVEKIRDLRLLAVKKDTENRYAGQRSWNFEVEEQGWRYHMSNINASIGRAQLRKICAFTTKRQLLVKTYRKELENLPVTLLNLDWENIVPHIFPILVPGEHRDNLKNFLGIMGIETGIHYKANHLLKKFQNIGCLNAAKFYSQELSLPLHCLLTQDHILRVTGAIKRFFNESEISKR